MSSQTSPACGTSVRSRSVSSGTLSTKFSVPTTGALAAASGADEEDDMSADEGCDVGAGEDGDVSADEGCDESADDAAATGEPSGHANDTRQNQSNG